MNNGKWQNWFEIYKGCRQGSPSSAIIFILIAEALRVLIKNNSSIKGLKIYQDHVKCCQYADDLWTIISPEADSINALMTELENFDQFSGLQVNYQKTVATKLGPCKALNFQFITKRTLSWTNDPIKILGLWVHQNFNVIYEYNFGPILNKCEVILNSWQHRGLTTMGRICFANSLIASLLS